ncbi:hypothetical protein BDP27DRAFT_1317447 [Rhodocollybia butyracea]|uniref:Uncharacterized protein n=1 Tax=Rhodocollybia butyracea TaxID=206335 RepID=A0A9P5UBJ6_9AGAR|nr:hypothetical protein BDP27DRAFT_1317447 [Rhodocollybia butyracea]
MGIAESISAVGMAGTVTGLSYTQATAQQKEEEEEAKRAAEVAAENNAEVRAGADETGPKRGAFPVSGSGGFAGGGRGRGPGNAGSGNTGRREKAPAVEPAPPIRKSRKDGRRKNRGGGNTTAGSRQKNENSTLAAPSEPKSPRRARRSPSGTPQQSAPPNSASASPKPPRGNRRAHIERSRPLVASQQV